MQKLKKCIYIGVCILLTIIVLWYTSISIYKYFPTGEPNRIRSAMASLLDSHKEIEGRYKNATVLRGESGSYFIVFDLLFNPDSRYTPPKQDGQPIGIVQAKSRYFNFNKTKISEFQSVTYYPDEDWFPGIIYGHYDNVHFGKFLNADISKIEFYVDNLLVQTFTRDKNKDHGTKDFFLIELDKNLYTYGNPEVRFMYYNERGEVLHEYY